jgi:hypothetical protein
VKAGFWAFWAFCGRTLSPFPSFPTGELERLFGDFLAFGFPAAGTTSGIESGMEPIGSETTPLGAELTINVALVDPSAVFGVGANGKETLVVGVLGVLTTVLVLVSFTTGSKLSIDDGTN